MFGSQAAPKFGPVKASEVKHLIMFCKDLVSKYREKIGAEYSAPLFTIGECLEKFILLMRDSPTIVPKPVLLQMFAVVFTLCTAWDTAELHVKPKRHLLLHLVSRIETHGNPSFYACWMDETLNKQLAAAGRASHMSVWELRLLRIMDDHRERVSKKPRF